MRMVLRWRGSPRRAARIGPVPRWNSIFSASRGTISFYPSQRGEESLFGRIARWRFVGRAVAAFEHRSEEHPSDLQPLMRISYAVFCLKKTTTNNPNRQQRQAHRHLTRAQLHNNANSHTLSNHPEH